MNVRNSIQSVVSVFHASLYASGLFVIGAQPVHASMDYYSLAENAVVMYDAPSAKSAKLFIANAHLPVEAVVNVEGWTKVRDSSGTMAWVKQSMLSTQRFVIVTVPMADVYFAADGNANVLFQATENVVMEWLDSDTPGWVHVKHRDGQTGYVRSNQVWGS